MKYELTQREGVIYSLKLEFEPAEVKEQVEAAAREIGKTAKLPGFRP
jgi:trigger factor